MGGVTSLFATHIHPTHPHPADHPPPRPKNRLRVTGYKIILKEVIGTPPIWVARALRPAPVSAQDVCEEPCVPERTDTSLAIAGILSGAKILVHQDALTAGRSWLE